MQYLLVPVIILCAIGGTVGILKGIKKIFLHAGNTMKSAQTWIYQHSTDNAEKDKPQDQ